MRGRKKSHIHAVVINNNKNNPLNRYGWEGFVIASFEYLSLERPLNKFQPVQMSTGFRK